MSEDEKRIIQKQIDTIKMQIRDLRTAKAALKIQLDNLNRSNERVVSMPWVKFRQLAIDYREDMWSQIDVKMKCMYKYKRNMCASGSFYQLKDPSEYVVCGICFEDIYSDTIGNVLPKEYPLGENVEFDLNAYPANIQTLLLKNGAAPVE